LEITGTLVATVTPEFSTEDMVTIAVDFRGTPTCKSTIYVNARVSQILEFVEFIKTIIGAILISFSWGLNKNATMARWS